MTKYILGLISAFLAWGGVAVIANTWVATEGFTLGIYTKWQFYVAALMFILALTIAEQIGKRGKRD
jgi:hypothetical protein